MSEMYPRSAANSDRGQLMRDYNRASLDQSCPCGRCSFEGREIPADQLTLSNVWLEEVQIRQDRYSVVSTDSGRVPAACPVSSRSSSTRFSCSLSLAVSPDARYKLRASINHSSSTSISSIPLIFPSTPRTTTNALGIAQSQLQKRHKRSLSCPKQPRLDMHTRSVARTLAILRRPHC